MKRIDFYKIKNWGIIIQGDNLKKTIKVLFVLILTIIISLYVGGLIFFNTHFFPKTYVNGKAVGLTKISDLEKNYENLNSNFKLEIYSREGKEEIDPKSFNYRDYLIPNQKIEQNPFTWIGKIFFTEDIKLEHNIELDRDKFKAEITNLNVVKSQSIEPQDAKVIYEDGEYLIKEEVLGNKLDEEKLNNALYASLESSSHKVDLVKDKIYKFPKYTKDSEDLKELLAEYKKIDSLEITYDFDIVKEKLTGQALINLFRREDTKLLPDKEKIVKYVRTLSKNYDTFKSTREFEATGIGKVRVQGGIYGWLMDINSTTDQLLSALEKRESKELKPVYLQTALHREKNNDIGSTYIEVDLARQHLWMYKDGNLILDTNTVTGNPNRQNSTPTGTDRIWSREKNRILKGEGYESHVNYWLPINWRGIGLHDASWRGNFGGNIYLSNGSHGCINIPPNVMPKLFENSFNGMPVVVYNSSTDKIA